MTKSTLVTQVFPTWLWLHDPSICIIVSSYADGLSVDHSLKAKRVIESDKWGLFQYYIREKFGHYLELTKSTEKYWINNYGGFYYATSTGGTVTGKHAHLIIRDDPLNPEQAISKAVREKTNRFNNQTLSTRKKDKKSTPTITVMQRLHDNDPTGHDIKKGIKIEHICLPAEIKDKDRSNVKPRKLMDRYKDGLLDVNRLSKEILVNEAKRLGSYGYSGQYGQSPNPLDGGIIKRKWFTILDNYPTEREIIWNFVLDTAFSSKASSNDTAIIAYTYHENNWYVRECLTAKLDFPDMLDFVRGFTTRNGYSSRSRIYIEPKATGTPLIQTIKRTTALNVVPTESPIQDKVTRANNHVPELEAGRVFLIRGAWNEDYLDELSLFPKSDQDGRVDITTYMMGIKAGVKFRVSTVKQHHRLSH